MRLICNETCVLNVDVVTCDLVETHEHLGAISCLHVPYTVNFLISRFPYYSKDEDSRLISSRPTREYLQPHP
jgi:hypothetical protein